MAIGVVTDMKIYDEEMQGGYMEAVSQKVALFNENSNNTLRLIEGDLLGDYAKEAFFKKTANVVSRQDLTSTADATALKMEQDENISVKLNRKIGPVDQALPALRRVGMTDREMSFILGGHIGEAILEDQINSLLTAAVAAIEGQAAVVHDCTALSSGDTISHANLNTQMSKFGDRSGALAAFVMDGVTFHNLIGQSITDNIFQVGGVTIIQGSTASFGRPVIVTDSSALQGTGGTSSVPTTTYKVAALVENAASIVNSEEPVVTAEIVTGKEQLVARYQGEFAYNVGVKGFKWDVTNGGSNPTAAALGTSTNWDIIATSNKDLAGTLGIYN